MLIVQPVTNPHNTDSN